MTAARFPHQDTLDLIHARTSVAHFDPQAAMDDETVADLIGHASQAPSAFNLQNWRFIAVKSAPRKAALCELCFGQRRVAEAAVTFVVVGILNGHKRIREDELPVMLVSVWSAGPGSWPRNPRRPVSEVLETA